MQAMGYSAGSAGTPLAPFSFTRRDLRRSARSTNNIQQHTQPLISGRRRLSGAPIGGVAETQEMVDFCARMNILPDCEIIAMQDINEAFGRLERADVRYRFVIDMASLSGEPS